MANISKHLSYIHTCNMCVVEQAVPLGVHAGKFFWFLLFQFLTLDYFTHVGIMSANLSPSLQIATTVVLTLVPTWNVLSGFYVPKPVSSAAPLAILCILMCSQKHVLLTWYGQGLQLSAFTEQARIQHDTL